MSPRTTWPDRAIAELAGHQATHVSRRQLLALGVSSRAVDRALARGRLHRVFAGVYSLVAPAVRPPLAGEHAALLLVAAEAVVSHASAARVHGLELTLRRDSRVHLTVVGDHRNRSRNGLCVHRSRRPLYPADHHRLRGLPVTSLARTAIDLAPQLGNRALERLLDEVLKRTSRTKLRDALARHRARPGVARVSALLDPGRPSSATVGRAEELLLELIRRAGLPAPEVNVALGDYVPDLMWRAQRVIVEFDSVAHHSGPAAFHHDRTRHNQLTTAGWTVLHVTWRQLRENPEQVLVWIATALALSGGGARP